jgi:hypothetical protein
MEGRSYFRFAEYERYITMGEEAALEKLPAILRALEQKKTAPEREAPSLNGDRAEMASVPDEN